MRSANEETAAHPYPDELGHASEPVTAEELARFFAVSIDVVEEWKRTGRIVEIVPGLFDVNDAIGRVHRAAKR